MTELFCPFIKGKCNTNCAFLDDETMSVCQLALSAKAMTDYTIIMKNINQSLQTISNQIPNQEPSSDD